MTQIKELYKLIENVDKDDTETLDQIDIKVGSYLAGDSGMFYVTPVARSIDAQKQIDTDGWFFDVTWYNKDSVEVNPWKLDHYDYFKVLPLQTEELARLHASLQVVEYKRGQK